MERITRDLRFSDVTKFSRLLVKNNVDDIRELIKKVSESKDVINAIDLGIDIMELVVLNEQLENDFKDVLSDLLLDGNLDIDEIKVMRKVIQELVMQEDFVYFLDLFKPLLKTTTIY